MRIAFTILLTLCVLFGNGQNLVPNPSFEIHTACPSNGGDINFASPWFQPCILSSSSDLFDTCGMGPMDIPLNAGGYQFPRTGSAYAGILFYSPGNGREYIEVGLLDSLIAGKKYCVEFYINLADSSRYALSRFGLYFSIDSVLINSNQPSLLPYTPQITNTGGKVIDTLNWTLIAGEYIATGGEKFITIGNFYDDANTSLQTVNPSQIYTYSYYYIDDVSVTCCDPSGCSVSLQEQEAANSISVFPNPFTSTVIFTITGNISYPLDLIIYNTTAQQVRREIITSNQYILNKEGLGGGIYFYSLYDKAGQLIKRGKLIIQ